MKVQTPKPTQKYIFYNTQEPGVAKSFSNNSLKGSWKKVCFHGATVELTDEQFDFIMQKGTPIYNYVNDPNNGKLEATKIDNNPRFNLRLVR